jgi:hypothetical protein
MPANVPQKPEDQKAKWYIGSPMLPRHTEELGRVVALWSRLEHLMNGVICQISGIGLNLGDVFFNNINMPARYMILESVAIRYLKDKDPRLCDNLLKCATKIREYKNRNLLVHGLWDGAGLNFATTWHPSRKTHSQESISWTVGDMAEVGNEISDFIMQISGCIERLCEILPRPPLAHRPWRRKPSLQPYRMFRRR